MSENAKNPVVAHLTIEDPPEYSAEKAENPEKPSSDISGPTGSGKVAPSTSKSETRPPSGSDFRVNNSTHYTKHRFSETPGESTEEAYQTAAHSTGYTDQLGSADWLGGPQNGSAIPGNGGSGGNGGNGGSSNG